MMPAMSDLGALAVTKGLLLIAYAGPWLTSSTTEQNRRRLRRFLSAARDWADYLSMQAVRLVQATRDGSCAFSRDG